MRSRVVLPMPLGPTRARRAPLATENETSRKISSAPNDLEREEAVISDMRGLLRTAAEQFLGVGLRFRRQRNSPFRRDSQIAAGLLPVQLLGVDARGDLLH